MTRKDAKIFIHQLWRETIRGSYGEEALEIAIEALEQPERKKGFWLTIEKGEQGYSAGDFRCSVCGKANPCYHLTEWCPNCGARMER